jgi:raffinose/stachyose/melibiose transport system permease protein
MLKGTTNSIIVLGIVGSLKTFDIVYMLTNGGPGVSSEVLTTFLYKRAFEEFNSGYASATGVVILILAAVMSAIQIRSYNESKRKDG